MNKPKNLKPSMTALPELLEERNENGKYNELIDKAKRGCYHDFKFDLADPNCKFVGAKMCLMHDLMKFPELIDIMHMTSEGRFDDSMDEEDTERMNEEFKDLNPGIKKIIGL